MNFNANNRFISATLQLYLPMQYELGLPKFCASMTNIVAIDNTKYTNAGVHTFFNPGRLAIEYYLLI